MNRGAGGTLPPIQRPIVATNLSETRFVILSLTEAEMVLAYTMIGGFIGLVSSVFAYFTFDVTFMTALMVYASVGVGTFALAAFSVALRPEDANASPCDHAVQRHEWGQEEVA